MINMRSMLLGAATLLVTTTYAVGSECDDKLTASLHDCQRIVGSLRPDKAGQMRVFASDGSEFTAGQAQWMSAQLKQVAKDCDHGNVDEASRRLADVQQLLSEHHHAA